MPAKDEIKINPEIVEVAQNIMEQLVTVRPEHSFSFILNDEGSQAIEESIKIADWGIGGNKSKLKATALEILDSINEIPAGEPVNVNFNEYDIKSLGEVYDALGKALEKHDEGLLP
jgi:hypothetical protein